MITKFRQFVRRFKWAWRLSTDPEARRVPTREFVISHCEIAGSDLLHFPRNSRVFIMATYMEDKIPRDFPIKGGEWWGGETWFDLSELPGLDPAFLRTAWPERNP